MGEGVVRGASYTQYVGGGEGDRASLYYKVPRLLRLVLLVIVL